jgi:hypothetical protein
MRLGLLPLFCMGIYCLPPRDACTERAALGSKRPQGCMQQTLQGQSLPTGSTGQLKGMAEPYLSVLTLRFLGKQPLLLLHLTASSP